MEANQSAPVAEFELAPYSAPPAKAAKQLTDAEIVEKALQILARKLRRRDEVFASPEAVKHYCRLQLGGLDHEQFGVLFLDAQNALIEFRAMFRGTLTQTSVYPREIVKLALELNAASVIFTHNHPSGTTNPSRADEALTQALKTALSLVDCRVLDHLIVTAGGALSMAEMGLI